MQATRSDNTLLRWSIGLNLVLLACQYFFLTRHWGVVSGAFFDKAMLVGSAFVSGALVIGIVGQARRWHLNTQLPGPAVRTVSGS